jgi:hypothetical protein
MSTIDNITLNALDQAIKTVAPHAAVDTVDYDKGIVYISHTYNQGTTHEWVDHKFMEINVASDSVPAIFYDVYTQVYDRCI